MKLILELFICACVEEGLVRYQRVCRDISDRHEDPDAISAELLAELGIDMRLGEICAHSTSWRYEAGNTILTYLVLGAGEALANTPTRLLNPVGIDLPKASGPLSPRPEEIREEHVLSHGLRHLCYLVYERGEPLVEKALAAVDAAGLLRRLTPAQAGRIL